MFEHVELKPTVCALLYVTNYCFVEAEWLYAGPGDYLKATWSLAVEEHFYLVFPLLLLTLFKHEKRFVYGVVGSLCVVALGFRLTYALLGKSEFFLVWRTETALDMLMAGCVISIMSSHEAGRRGLGKLLQPWVLLLATAIFAVSLIGWSYGGLWIALSQSALAIWLAVLLANVLLNPEIAGVRSVLNRPFMVWLGKISYSLYLWHALVAFLGHHFHLVDTVPGAIVAMIVSAILAHASWRWIEQPVLRRRSDWARRLGVGAPRARAVPAE